MPRDLTEALRRQVSFESDHGEGYINAAFESEKVEDGAAPVVIRMEDLADPMKPFQELEETWIELRELKADVDLVREQQDKILNTVNPDEITKFGLEMLMENIKTKSLEMRTKLKVIDAHIDETEKDIQPSDGSVKLTEIRMRRTQSAALKKTFANTMDHYQRVQTEYRDRCKGRIRSQIEISGTDISEDDVEEMLEKGNWNVFGQSIIQETQEARQRLADVQARHNDIIKLEQSLLELHDLFMEMAALIESQGEVVDRIESHVATAVEYVEASVVVLKKAQQLQTSSRKKTICIIVTIIILIIVLGLIIYFSIPK